MRTTVGSESNLCAARAPAALGPVIEFGGATVTWEDALEDLRDFRPVSRPRDHSLGAAELLLVEEETDRLIRFAGQFTALLAPDMRNELERRADALLQETAGGSEYDRERLKAIDEFIRPLHGNQIGASGEGRWGTFESVECGLSFPWEYASKLMFAQGKCGSLTSSPACVTVIEAARHWCSALTSLRDRLDRRKYWGSVILREAADAQDGSDEEYAGRLYLRRMLAPDLHAASWAVLDAATDLGRWQRESCQAPAPVLKGWIAGNTSWFRHSKDFRSVNWGDREFQFTTPQADCVKALWQAVTQRIPGVSHATLLEKCDTSSDRLANVFRVRQGTTTKPHAAWGTMIVVWGRKGLYRIVPPPDVAGRVTNP